MWPLGDGLKEVGWGTILWDWCPCKRRREHKRALSLSVPMPVLRKGAEAERGPEAATCKPGEFPVGLHLGLGETCSLQNYEKIHCCYFSHPACHCAWQPQLSQGAYVTCSGLAARWWQSRDKAGKPDLQPSWMGCHPRRRTRALWSFPGKVLCFLTETPAREKAYELIFRGSPGDSACAPSLACVIRQR